jgi:CRP-like cAMP-binding protein
MKIGETLSVMEKAILLMETDLFRGVSADEVAFVAAKTVEMRFEAGEILEPGSPARDCFHVVVEGVVEARLEDRLVRRVTRGMGFGLLPVLGLDDGVGLQAVEASHTIALSGEDLRQALADHPAFAFEMIRELASAAREVVSRLEAGKDESD